MKKNKIRGNHAYVLAWFHDENITEFVIFFISLSFNKPGPNIS